MSFSQRLELLLKERNVTWKTVSEELEIGKNQKKYWETKNTKPDGDTLVKLARYFEVSTDFLLGIETLKEKTEVILDDPAITLTADEKWFVLKLRELDKEGKTMVESAIISELRRIAAEKEHTNVG